jgi:hypothetical protein
MVSRMPNDFPLILCSAGFGGGTTRVSNLEWAVFGFPSENAIKVSIDAVPTGRAAPRVAFHRQMKSFLTTN